MKSNLVLIGMPATGKSTVGVILAKTLGMDFIDTDLVIQKQTGKKLCDLIAELGSEGFKALEGEVCASVDAENTVIATGGSAVYSEKGMEALKKNGTVLYLKTSKELLFSRLRDVRRRGVVLAEGQTLDDLYEERAPLYEKHADVIVKEESDSIEDSVIKSLAALVKTGKEAP